ncbi:3-ketoacyl-ACP reductase [Lentisphaerota bacterium WC36G]|nr:3-ketoacyl-ACP reductase [Lentisphaerae bacterium WC36]
MKKVAIVTGGARGIGFGIAEKLATENCDLVIADIQKESDYQDNMDKLRNLGAEVLYCQCDVTSADDRKAMIEAIDVKFGRINVLVNNAGVAPRVRADILEATEESYDFVMGINLKGPYFLTQAVANYMIEAKKSNSEMECYIVNMSSVSATVPSPFRGEYCMSKAGISMATLLWAARLGEYNIPVYEVRPGVIKTDMTSSVTEKYDKLLEEGLCLQARWGYPEDIGKTVAMMVRGDIAYSTGQVINVDGGMTINVL